MAEPPLWFVPGDGSHDDTDGVAGCELTIVHCHVGDQIYYSKAEYEAVFPDGVPDKVNGLQSWIQTGFTDSRRVQGFAVGGIVRPSDHSSPPARDFNVTGPNPHEHHVHVSVAPTEKQAKEVADKILKDIKGPAHIPAGTIMVRNPDGTVRPMRSGDTAPVVGAKLWSSDGSMSDGGVISVNISNNLNISPSWSDPNADPTRDINEYVRRMMG